MFTTRNLLITGAALIAMGIVFVSTHDWGGDEAKSNQDLALRTFNRPAPTRTISAPTPPATQTAAEPVESEPAVVEAAEPPREVTYEEAEAAFHEKRYGEAADLFASYAERKSENPWGFYMLGLSAWKAGDFAQAETAFNQSLELDKRHVKSYLSLSRVLLDTSRPAEVLTKIEEALAIDSESSVAYRLKGRACYQLGRMDDAINAYRTAIRLDDQDAWSMNNLGLVYIEQGRFEEALPALARAVELDSAVAVFQNNLGMALECNGHFRDAEGAYELAVEIDESYDNASANLARISEVAEDTGVEPVDLAALAQSFVEEIKSWNVAVAQGDEIAEPETDATVIDEFDTFEAAVIEPDSTRGEEDR
jgi:Flp pilus assembly protein TadD